MKNFNVKEYIRESNLIESIDDRKEDKQSLAAWNFLSEQDKLSKRTLRTLHELITLNQMSDDERGTFRNELRINVFIGGHMAPPHYMVGGLIDNWLLDYAEGAEEPIIAHIKYEHIHCWADGNGRTGRMLLWWHELKNGTKPTLFKASEKYEKYYTLFS